MTPHSPGTWFLAPSTDRSDEYAAGYDGNTFACREDAEAAIPGLQACGEDFAATEWVAVQRTPCRSHNWVGLVSDGHIHNLCDRCGAEWNDSDAE